MATTFPTSGSPVPAVAEIPAAVHAELTEFFNRRRAEIADIGQPVVEAVSHLEQFVLGGGKRVRPLYAWAGFIGAGGLAGPENPQAIVRAAASLEFIQACALVHDDIIDASDTRRGNPTVHRAVEAAHGTKSWGGNSAEFGRSMAILIGDLALVWAEDMFQDSGVSPAALARSRAPWRGMRTEVIGGQLLDISLEASGNESEQLANSVNRYKTAAYTIERPLHLGAALAGAPDVVVEAFRGYGRDIGIAYQLRDDLLGVFGDPQVTGKPAGDDLREGKRTVLLSLALQLADATSPHLAAELRRGVGTATDSAELARLADIIADTGAPDEVERRITALTETGLRHLDHAKLEPEVTELLHNLAISATSRKY